MWLHAEYNEKKNYVCLFSTSETTYKRITRGVRLVVVRAARALQHARATPARAATRATRRRRAHGSACSDAAPAPVSGHTIHYATLRHTTLHYATLHYTTLHYTTLHYTILHVVSASLCAHCPSATTRGHSQVKKKIFFFHDVK